MNHKPLRGEIWWVDWSPGRGSEQIGRRPALIIQNDKANQSKYYNNTIVVAISTRGLPVPFHVPITPTDTNGLSAPSFIQCEQVMTISCDRLDQFIGCITPEELRQVDLALQRVLSLG